MKIMLSKALVFAVICLFIGVGFVPVFVAEAAAHFHVSSDEQSTSFYLTDVQ